MTAPLALRDIKVTFARRGFLGRGREAVSAVDDVSLEIGEAEIVALVGASGSGKTTLMRVALGLQRADAGTILWDGRPLASLSGRALRACRRRMLPIFQDPSEALNPGMTIERIIGEGLVIHRLGTHAEREERIETVLSFVGLDPPRHFLHRHAHTLSGGQRQRVAIAAALVLEPELLVADEPVSMLDPSIRASILDLFRRLRDERGMSTLMVTHDLPSAHALADRVLVMDRGRIVEEGTVTEVFARPQHDYTRRLIAAAVGR